MKIKQLNPVNSSSRHSIKQCKSALIKNSKITKKTRIIIKKSYGRCKKTGHITAWHRQKGAKKLYKIQITNKPEIKSLLIGVNHNPNANSLSSLNFNFVTKKFFNDLHIKNTYPGSLITKTNEVNELRNGYRSTITNIPTGTLISNINLPYKKYGQYSKAAGTFSQLIQKDYITAKLKLPSNKIIEIPATSQATVGTVSNELYRNIKAGKAGRNRNLGRRPIVRGIAMNPVDHPHGGRTNGGQLSSTPWGLPTKNGFKLKKRTYKNKKNK